ncbi:Bcr/CflA family efflux MFS transporter [Actinoplanes sp. NPDC049596]|uniref:Bcr/CflA family efflux MFS transporter n=1 Tax=unclassified Actinoplanes TaxID=2626549 RepID=UPI0034294FCA
MTSVSDVSQASVRRARLTAVLCLVVAIGPLTTDLYLPALPSLAGDLHVGASAVQLTFTGMLAGLTVGQLLLGPLSDRVGRRRVLLSGLSVYVLASVLCAVAPDVVVLDVLRVIQGGGSAAAAVVALAVVSDVFTGGPAATVMSRLALVLGVAPVMAPALGGLVVAWTSWRGVFLLLAVAGAVILGVAAWALPETLPASRRRATGPATFRGVLGDPRFRRHAAVAGLAAAAMFAYVSGAPFLFQRTWSLSERQSGLLFGAGAIVLVLAAQVNVWLLRRFPPAPILVAAAAVGTAAGAALLAGVVAALWPALFAVGLIMPNAQALAMSRQGPAAGTAAAALGAVTFGAGALVAPLVGAWGSPAVVMGAAITTSLGAATVLLLTERRGDR